MLELTDEQKEKLGPEFIKEWEKNHRPWLWVAQRVDLTYEQLTGIFPMSVTYRFEVRFASTT